MSVMLNIKKPNLQVSLNVIMFIWKQRNIEPLWCFDRSHHIAEIRSYVEPTGDEGCRHLDTRTTVREVSTRPYLQTWRSYRKEDMLQTVLWQATTHNSDAGLIPRCKCVKYCQLMQIFVDIVLIFLFLPSSSGVSSDTGPWIGNPFSLPSPFSTLSHQHSLHISISSKPSPSLSVLTPFPRPDALFWSFYMHRQHRPH